jgi:hypothetical protein
METGVKVHGNFHPIHGSAQIEPSPFSPAGMVAFPVWASPNGRNSMFDFMNPALREAKRRAKEEYKQRVLQGKIDACMQDARDAAHRKLYGPKWYQRHAKAMVYVFVFFVVVALAGKK